MLRLVAISGGAISGAASLTGGNFSSDEVEPVRAETGYYLTAAGSEEGLDDTNGKVQYSVGTWLLSGAAADYDVRVTLVGDALDVSSDSTGTWLTLGSNRAWELTQTFEGSSFSTLTVEIRINATSVVVATTTVILDANVTII